MNHLCRLFLCALCVLCVSANAQLVKSGWTSTSDAATARTALGFVTTNINEFNTTNNYSVTNFYTVTNWGALAPGAVYVDANTGNDTTGTGALDSPVATLTKGQELATNGGTVVVVRGSFNESNLGKDGVEWFFSAGVFVTGNPVFNLTNTVCTNLVVRGEATFSNRVVEFNNTTNVTARLSLKNYIGASAQYFFGLRNGDSNTIRIKAVEMTGVLGLFFTDPAPGYLGTFAGFVEVENAVMNPALGSYPATSNLVLTVKCTDLRAGGNGFFTSSSYSPTNMVLIIDGGRFSRNGRTFTSASSNLWFKGVSLRTTNDCNVPTVPVRGTYYVEFP